MEIFTQNVKAISFTFDNVKRGKSNTIVIGGKNKMITSSTFTALYTDT